MNIFRQAAIYRWTKALAASVGSLSLCACGVLGKSSSPSPAFYELGGMYGTTNELRQHAAPGSKLTLIISKPHAASGFDSQRIVYLRETHHLEHFAHSEWTDPPARMLGPLLVTAIQKTGYFSAVVLASGTASGDLRLSTDILRLQHNFQTNPSKVQLTLRAYLTDEKSHRVLTWRDFHGEAIAASDTPSGGVAAANVVVQEVLIQVAQFMIDWHE